MHGDDRAISIFDNRTKQDWFPRYTTCQSVVLNQISKKAEAGESPLPLAPSLRLNSSSYCCLTPALQQTEFRPLQHTATGAPDFKAPSPGHLGVSAGCLSTSSWKKHVRVGELFMMLSGTGRFRAGLQTHGREIRCRLSA